MQKYKCPFCDYIGPIGETGFKHYVDGQVICPGDCGDMVLVKTLEPVGKEEPEEDYEEVEVPDCFGYEDRFDVSCRRCVLREYCIEEKEANKPECFAKMYDDQAIECQVCLIASQCVEEHKPNGKETKVSKRKIKIQRRRPRRTKEEEVIEEVEEVEEEEQEDEEVDYGSWTVKELREELEERGLSTKGRKSQLVGRLYDDDEGVEPESDEEELPKAEDEEEEEVVEIDVKLEAGDDVFDQIMAELSVGKTLHFTKTKGGWDISASAGVPTVTAVKSGPARVSSGLTGSDYDKEVMSEAYWNFDNEDAGEGKAWRDMTPEEREEFVFDVLEVEIPDWDDMHPRVQAMRLKQYALDHLGVEKYKEEYQTRKSRKEVKEGYVAPKYV